MKFEMKKRILALALAGTTAFSVFGAAVSANAAVELPSAQYVTNNDQYKQYTPVAKVVASTYNKGTVSNTKINKTNGTMIGADKTYKTVKEYIDAQVPTQEDFYAQTNYLIDGKNKYVPAFYTDKQKAKALGIDVVPDAATPTIDKYVTGNKQYDTYAQALAALLAVEGNKEVETVYMTDHAVGTYKQWDYITKADYDKLYVSDAAYEAANILETGSTAGTAPTGGVKVSANTSDGNKKYESIDGTDGWGFNGETSADTTIYPWTTTSTYVKDANGITIEVNQAKGTPTVYLLDFIPYNSTTAYPSAIASAYNSTTDNVNHVKAAALMGEAVWTAETGRGGNYGIRAEVVNDYESFLSDLVLLKSNGYTVSESAFKSEYKDLYVSGYLYNPYTGLATGAKWTTDLYNIDTLLSDIYKSSVGNAYLNYNTSEMMYLMQQYNKYVGYINKEEVSKDEWGDLLVSILENVAEDDFKKATDYKQFKRKAEDVIDAYNDATTSSLVKAAEQAMYNLVTSTSTRSTGASDEKKALNSDLYSLYFNAATLPANYTTVSAAHGNAALKNYAYLKAVTLGAGSDLVQDKTQMTVTTKTGAGYFSLYPQADYKQTGNAVNGYVGNDATKYTGEATDEYEWFLNVYELAAKVNGNNTSSSIGGVVSAVDEALTKAVSALNVTVSASNSAATALDETVAGSEKTLDFYVTGNGVNEGDFNATYYNAYTAAVAYADKAEGAAQVANAKAMVAVAADALTYNGTQTTVTKADITTLNASIKNAQAALKSIKDSANYNAAQVTALNNAIAQAQDIVAIFNGTNGAFYNKVNKTSAAYVGDKDAIVKSDITGAISAIDSAINYSNVVMGWSKNDAGKWQYGTEDGYLSNGWNKIGATWYYFNADGTAKQSEWFQENGKWYYFNSNCGAAYNWCKVDGNWYYFNGDNAMRTGWLKKEGSWYYLASSGKMVTGWTQIDGKWYYFSKESNSLGQMAANTTVDGYKVNADGVWVK